MKTLIAAALLSAIGAIGALASCARSNSTPPPETPPSREKTGDADRCELEFAKLQQCGVLKWEELPTQSSYGRFSIELTSAAPLAPDANLTVRLWMPAMGHGSRPVTIERAGASRFDVTNVFFTMSGQWEIQAQIHAPSGAPLDEATLRYDAHL